MIQRGKGPPATNDTGLPVDIRPPNADIMLGQQIGHGLQLQDALVISAGPVLGQRFPQLGKAVRHWAFFLARRTSHDR